MRNEDEALTPTTHELVVKMTAEARVAALAQAVAEALALKLDAEDLCLATVVPLKMTAGVASTEPVTLCLRLMEARLWDSRRGICPNFKIQMDLSVSVTRTQGRLNLERDVIGRLVKDRLRGDSMTRHMDVEGHLLNANHESEA